MATSEAVSIDFLIFNPHHPSDMCVQGAQRELQRAKFYTYYAHQMYFFFGFQHFKKISVTFFLGFRPFNQYFSLQTISYKGSETQKHGTQNLLKILKFSKKKYT